jgi:nitrogen regulatory protein P-II 1
MKKIEAMIKPFKLDDVRNAVSGLGLSGMTISEVEGCGRHERQNGGREYNGYGLDIHPQIKLEIVVADSLSGIVTAAIAEAARTGRLGDGNIFISHVEAAIRIRTRETDQSAVC